ncbi:hypothetical protein WN72_32385 [Bradyrhizobium arachidis]|uniref:Uncharacterized protein n=1 Tax=Bradyrhizobium arachidis TaxID=858423 RepID=A0AAE7TJX6_9BRAD|nr:hypothetical protein WN72_32385 [Bradyrhizobium arachidis]
MKRLNRTSGRPVILGCEWRDAKHRAGSLEGCTAEMLQRGRRPSRAAGEAATSGDNGFAVARG